MADASNRNKPRASGRDGSELGVVRIRSNPAPDAQDRLRRLASLLVRYATADRKHSPDQESLHGDDGTGGE